MKHFVQASGLFFLLSLISCSTNNSISFEYDDNIPQVEFAVNNIKAAYISSVNELKNKVDLIISFQQEQNSGEAGGFSIRQTESGQVIIKAADANGLMYGGLELAEQLSLYKEIRDTESTPFIKKRGIKMNIPLDARTPSYDDTGDAAQKNILEMWSWEFWEEYLDKLAINRYNTLTLWNPHPFPSMIKMSEFPDVALDDICMTTLKPTGKEGEWAEPQMVSSNVLDNLKVVKKMTIDEKILFWQKVMQRAHDRGIDIYFFTWNICPNGAANPVEPFYQTWAIELWDEIPGKNGISNQMDNPITADYYRKAVKAFLLTYPNIKGIGITAGEHMMDEAGKYTREQWIWESYGMGILDASKEDPDRRIDFIHRVWNTDMDKIMAYWKDYPGSFEASFKYARARLYSSPELPFADKHIRDMEKYGLKSWWNLRNDDIFVHRWGDPDYVREFIGNFDREHTAGFYMGSDGYVWGREFLSRNPEISGQLEIDKHWYKFMLWGRLAYDNNLDRSFFVSKLKERFPDTDSELLYSSWQAASRIIPQVNRFHWRDWDYQWSVEACRDMRTSFHDVREFIANPTMSGSNILNPKAYARASVAGTKTTGITPLQVSENLGQFAAEALEGVRDLRVDDNPAELIALLDDMEAMSYLGQYYARKIEAATELAFFSENNMKEHQNKAVSLMEEAVDYWEMYTEISESNYYPQRLARTQMLDWTEILTYVKKDVDIARTYSPKATNND